jgi:hypothetical protein
MDGGLAGTDVLGQLGTKRYTDPPNIVLYIVHLLACVPTMIVFPNCPPPPILISDMQDLNVQISFPCLVATLSTAQQQWAGAP